MRIPLISRVPVFPVVLFAGGLFLVQQLEKTDLTFSGLCALYIILSGIAINISGGLTRPAGGFIFSAALFTVIIGVVFKAILGEPGQSNLASPVQDMLIYNASMAMYALLAQIVKYFRPKEGLLARFALGETAKKAAFGCLAFGVALICISLFTALGTLTLFTELRQINVFLPMAMLLAIFYEVKISGGKRSTNWITWTAGLTSFFTGVVAFSKEGMFAPPLTWFIACVAAGHNFTRKQILAGTLALVLMTVFLVPFSQLGRNFKDEQGSFVQDTKSALQLLTNLSEVRRSFLDAQKVEAEQEDLAPHYFNSGQGLFDRLTIFGPDDALITYTDDVSEEGFGPTIAAYANIVPRFLWPDKPFNAYGNIYAHEVGGVLADEDTTTGISFSPSADAYHQARWLGLFTVLPLTMFLLFFVTETLAGDLRKSPWGLIFVIGSAHTASEGMIGGQVHIFTVGAFGIVFVALMARFVLPVVGGVLLNQERSRVRKTIDFRSA